MLIEKYYVCHTKTTKKRSKKMKCYDWVTEKIVDCEEQNCAACFDAILASKEKGKDDEKNVSR
jgi:hypothetical protein